MRKLLPILLSFLLCSQVYAADDWAKRWPSDTPMQVVTPTTGASSYWTQATDQTGLTGDKSGSFDLITTGLGTLGSLWVNGTNGAYGLPSFGAQDSGPNNWLFGVIATGASNPPAFVWQDGTYLRFGTSPTIGGAFTQLMAIGATNGLELGSYPILTTGTLGAGAITGTSLTDGTLTIDDGSITGGVAATFSGIGTFGTGYIGNATDQLQQTFDATDNSNPLYTNLGGTGNRTTIITVTSTAIGAAYRPLFSLVDGVNPPTFFGCYWNDGNFLNKYVRFDFGEGSTKRITEVKLYQQTSSVGGTWQWQGSNNAIDWTNIGNTWTITTGASQVLGDISANAVGYRYYQMIGTAGAKGADPWIYEFEFKIDDYGVSSILQTYDNSVATGILSLQTEGGIARIAGLQIDQGGNIATTGKFLLGGLAVDDDTLVVDAVNHRIGMNQAEPLFTLHVNGTITSETGAINVGYSADQNQYSSLVHSGAGNNSLTISSLYAGNGNLISLKPGTVEAIRMVRNSATLAGVAIGAFNPTAALHLKAGTATAGTAPLKFTSGTLLGTPEAGAIEYLSNYFYMRSDGLDIGKDLRIGGVVALSTLTAETGADYCTFVGTDAPSNSGLGNLFIGYGCGASNTSGVYNMAIGYDCLTHNQTQSYNTAIGYGAMHAATGGGSNVAVGISTLTACTSGDYNVAIGNSTGSGLTSGSQNTLIGNQTATGVLTGLSNVAIGEYNLAACTSGGYNTAIGGYCLYSLTTTSSNTAVGYAAGLSTTGDSSVYIGSNAGRFDTAGSSLYIDNQNRTNQAGDRTKALIYGIFNATPASQSITFNVGTLNAGADTDAVATFGRAKVGYMGYADYAGFSHYDHASGTDYALLQGPSGETYLNSASGQKIQFNRNNVAVGYWDTDGTLDIYQGANNNVALAWYRNESGGSYNTQWFSYIPASSTELRWYNGADLMTLTTAGALSIASNFTIGNGTDTVDYTLTFNGHAGDGIVTWMEDEKRFDFDSNADASCLRIAGTDAANDYTDLYTDTDGDFHIEPKLQYLVLGNQVNGIDYGIYFNGNGSQQEIYGDEDNDLLLITDEIRASTSLYRRYYHLSINAIAPGASGATWTEATANNLAGWQLNAAGELVNFDTDVHADWDGASDFTVDVYFQLLSAGVNNDTVDLKLVVYYMASGDSVVKTQTLADVVVTTDGTQYKMYKATFTVPWDAVADIEVGDRLSFVMNLETDTSEIDNILVVNGSIAYNTSHVGIEASDT